MFYPCQTKLKLKQFFRPSFKLQALCHFGCITNHLLKTKKDPKKSKPVEADISDHDTAFTNFILAIDNDLMVIPYGTVT